MSPHAACHENILKLITPAGSTVYRETGCYGRVCDHDSTRVRYFPTPGILFRFSSSSLALTALGCISLADCNSVMLQLMTSDVLLETSLHSSCYLIVFIGYIN